MTLEEINLMSAETFVTEFGGLYEHSPWIAEQASDLRPFTDVGDMLSKLAKVVREASHHDRLDLLRAHPELAGKAAIDGTLTEASAEEQASAALDRMLPAEFEDLTKMNADYRAWFGFPFIICVRQNNKAGILNALRGRLNNSREVEFEIALGQVNEIVRLRLEAKLS